MTINRVIAIDWSGDAKRASEKIWTAFVEHGALRELRNGRDPDTVVQFLVEAAAQDPLLVVGFDFGFSFPAWFVESHEDCVAVWKAVAANTIGSWRDEASPFFGTKNSAYSGQGSPMRLTDVAMKASSVFKVSGAGSVGTGSMMGMPILARLAERGFSIWPFMKPTLPIVVEIYPRACLIQERTRRIPTRFSKTNPIHRRAYFTGQLAGPWLDLAASTEDAFDAAVSAFALWDSRTDLESLPAIGHATLVREGIIWSPDWRTRHSEWLQE